MAKSLAGERIKKRLEALEQFQDASTAGLPVSALSDERLVESSNSSDLTRSSSRTIVSSLAKMASTCHVYCPQDQCISTGCPISTSPSEEAGNSDACYILPEQPLGVGTPLLEESPYFKPCNEKAHSPIWPLGEPMENREDGFDIRKRPGNEDDPLSDQPHEGFSEFLSSLGEDKVRALQFPTARFYA